MGEWTYTKQNGWCCAKQFNEPCESYEWTAPESYAWSVTVTIQRSGTDPWEATIDIEGGFCDEPISLSLGIDRPTLAEFMLVLCNAQEKAQRKLDELNVMGSVNIPTQESKPEGMK